MPCRVSVSRTRLGRTFIWLIVAVNPPPPWYLPVTRRLWIALIFSIPPLAWVFLLTSSSAVWAWARTQKKEDETATSRTRAWRIEQDSCGQDVGGRKRNKYCTSRRRSCQGSVSNPAYQSRWLPTRRELDSSATSYPAPSFHPASTRGHTRVKNHDFPSDEGDWCAENRAPRAI